MPGIKITNEDRQRIDAKFICTSCSLLLYIPMQTMCGHLMCQSCIETLLGRSDPKCPKDGEQLSKEKVFPDVFTKRELDGLRLHCANPGCSWESAYENLKEHVDSSCEGALVSCEHCGECVLRKNIKNHEKELCKPRPVTCDFKAIGCNHDETLKLNQLNQHMEEGLKNHVWLLLQYTLAFVTQLSNYIPRPEFAETMHNNRHEMEARLTSLGRQIETSDAIRADVVNELRRDVEDLTAENSSLRERIVSLERQVQNIVLITGSRPQCTEDLELEIDSPSHYNIHSHHGTLVWKIESYQKKRQDAINGVRTALYSPPFYSAHYGYKMCAKIYMNGDGIGQGTHLSLFHVVMRGDYDVLQTWPFQKKITMMLLDQGNGDHMIHAFHSDPQSSSFQRPKSDMNIASGSPLFVPLDSLNNRLYIKDDVMFIKIIVD